MNEICKFATGDLVRYVFPWSERATRFYLVLRTRKPIPDGAIEVECWDPMIRGYTKFWDYDLRIVSLWSERYEWNNSPEDR